MKIKGVLDTIKSGTVNPIYFLKGNDQFLQSLFVKKVSETFFGEDPVDKTLMLPDDMKGKEIVDQLTTRDLFSSNKLFVLRNPQQLKGKMADDLLTYCRSPMESHVLVMIINDWLDKSAFSKKMGRIVEPIEVRTPFGTEMRKWANYFFKEEEKKVHFNVIDFMVEMAGDSLAHLKNEIKKVCIWTGEKDTINAEDIGQFSGWQRERQRWEFLGALGSRDLDQAIALGKTIITQNETLISLLYPLTYLFQEMLFVKMNHGTFQGSRGYMPISPSVRKRIPQFSRGFTKEKLKSALTYLGEIDKRQKTAYISDETELVHFISHVIG